MEQRDLKNVKTLFIETLIDSGSNRHRFRPINVATGRTSAKEMTQLGNRILNIYCGRATRPAQQPNGKRTNIVVINSVTQKKKKRERKLIGHSFNMSALHALYGRPMEIEIFRFQFEHGLLSSTQRSTFLFPKIVFLCARVTAEMIVRQMSANPVCVANNAIQIHRIFIVYCISIGTYGQLPKNSQFELLQYISQCTIAAHAMRRSDQIKMPQLKVNRKNRLTLCIGIRWWWISKLATKNFLIGQRAPFDVGSDYRSQFELIWPENILVLLWNPY